MLNLINGTVMKLFSVINFFCIVLPMFIIWIVNHAS